MLSKDTIQHMADLFFNGEPEKAYELFHDSNEWLQFQNSICKVVPEIEAYGNNGKMRHDHLASEFCSCKAS